MNNRLIILLAIIIAHNLQGQHKCTEGFKAFESFRFAQAIDLFKSCLNQMPRDSMVMHYLADSYRYLGDVENAAFYYRSILEIYPDKLHISEKLKSLSGHPNASNKPLPEAEPGILPDIAASDTIIVRPAPFNSAYSDYSPAYFGKNIIFSSARPGKSSKDVFTGQNFSRLYIFDTESNSIETFAPELKNTFNTGACTFSNDLKVMYYTRNRKQKSGKGIFPLEIALAKHLDNQWLASDAFNLNSLAGNVAHPSVNPKNKLLLFSADLTPRNGLDLMLAINEGDSWKISPGTTRNVNSIFTDAFPVFTGSVGFVFSSDRPGGYGGLDLYYAEIKRDSITKPVLLPPPFNSEADDYGLIYDASTKTGYFTSTREHAGVDNIYHFQLLKSDDKETAFNTEDIVNIQENSRKSALSSPMESVSVPEFSNPTPPVTVSDHKLPDSFVLEGLYYDFDKWNIRSDAALILDNLFEILRQRPNLKIRLIAHTDSRGSHAYNQKLSEKRALSAVKYLIMKGINPQRLSHEGRGESEPVNQCRDGVHCSETLHQANRRTEVVVTEQ